MKFFGQGICWNPKLNRPLCEFTDGVYETVVSDEIEALSQMYPHDEAVVMAEPEVAEPKPKRGRPRNGAED